MKFLCIVFFLLIGLNVNAQAFSFVDTSTILVKTTDESPAHWYLEIYNEVGVDTTLRWKAWFDPNMPPQWVITFDDQNNFYNPVSDGDSADFTLYAAPTFPQKLIIGGILNNTPGTASAYFDIYDPADPSYVQTIEYRFIISMGSGTWGTDELTEEEQWFTQSGRTFTFMDEFNSNDVVLYDNTGRRVLSEKVETNQFEIDSDIPSGIYFLTMKMNNSFYSSRIIL